MQHYLIEERLVLDHIGRSLGLLLASVRSNMTTEKIKVGFDRNSDKKQRRHYLRQFREQVVLSDFQENTERQQESKLSRKFAGKLQQK